MTAQQSHNFAARNKKVTIMNTKYTIKNFRVFDEKGVTVDIKPITILTGCNSSGKSSIVKSMVLFNSLIGEMKRNYIAGSKMQLGKFKLDFSQGTTFDLGNFRRVIHDGSSTDTIECKYTIESKYLGETVIVSLLFALENAEMNGGVLAGVSICKSNGEQIYSSFDYKYHRENPSKYIFNLISMRQNFFHFVLGQHLVDAYRSYEMCASVLANSIENDLMEGYEGPTKEELEEWEIGLKERKQSFCRKYGEDVLKKVISWFNDFDNSIFDKVLGNSTFIGKYVSHQYEIVEKAESYGTLFYVPVYEKICELNKQSFRAYMDSLKNHYEMELELQYAIEMVVSAFEESDYNTFSDYWNAKESEFHKKNIVWGVNQWYDYLSDCFNVSELDLLFKNGHSDGATDSNFINFKFLCEVVMNIDYLINGKSPYYIISKEPGSLFPSFGHAVYKMFLEYVRFTNNDILFTKLYKSMSYVGTSLVNVKRLYTLDGDNGFSNILRRYFEERRNPEYAANYGFGGFYPGSFINKWTQKLGIGNRIGIHIDEEGLGATFRLYRDENDKKGSLLAEQGYGITQLLVILLRIELAIMDQHLGEIVFEDDLYMGKDTVSHRHEGEWKDTTIAIEEPEVHLHPKMQSMLAEIFVDAYTNYNVHFIIETHSEYIIRKIQLLVANKEVKNSDISLLYVYDEKNKPGYEPQVKKIGIRKDGMLNGNFGEGFFDEADMLSMYLLTAGSDGEE